MPPTVQRLTPRGPGAVAVLELRCYLSQQLTELCSAFSAGPSHDLNNLPIGRIIYGQWGGEDIVLIRTEQSAWEIHCHGGPIAIQRIINDLLAVGVRSTAVSETGRLSPQEVNDAAITTHVESVLSQCRTRKTAAIVLAQTDGRLHQLWRNLKSNDEVVRLSAEKTRRAWQHVADHIASPWTVALVGPPNAGKSSLMNAIAGRQRAIVSETPGTTRDLLEAEVIIDGWPFLFVDSAGIRNSTSSQIEEAGISRSKALAESADVVCLVIDHSSTFTETDLLHDVKAPSCVLLNKTDLPKSQTLDQLVIPAAPRFEVSAATGDGLSTFLAWLVREVIPTEPDVQTTVPILPASADSN